MKKLSGERISPSAVMAMLELINGCQEPGSLSVADRYAFAVSLPKTKSKVGRMFMTSTVADMDNNGSEFKELWNE